MLTQRLRHRVTIQRQQITRNPVTNGETLGWVDRYADVPAEVLTGAGREPVAVGVKQQETDARILIRWLPDVVQSDRVLWEGFMFDIIGIETDATARRDMRLRCTAVVGGGDGR